MKRILSGKALLKRLPHSGQYSDIVLAGAVVAIISLMILPLPLLLIDTLVAINILLGVGLVLLAIYIPAATAFSAFPSVLLLGTLFRLSLSIAITRLILLDADAGHIVETFGSLVAGGNLVVGLVVFLIITVVQFIVIAKGAERVAEVAARFSLDAMPGKQLSIDSDLRSGLIDKDDARRRRRLLEVESQLHGSLDGAMKFVKGDAIAGIVIIIINILGGLAVGVLQRDMDVGQAMHTYSILTIGDGLVAQIPALLSSISAGLIVTRTASAEGEDHLGESIARQISGQPRVFVIGGVLSLLLALVPGFPWPVFLMLGSALLGGSLLRLHRQGQTLSGLMRGASGRAVALLEAPQAHGSLEAPPAVSLELGPDLQIRHGREALQASAQAAVDQLRDRFGVPIAPPVLRTLTAADRDGYLLSVHGVRIAYGRCTAEDSLNSWEQQLAALLRRQLCNFIGIQETSNLISRWARDYPDLVKEMFRVAAPQRVSEILRRLVEEGVSIRSMRDVFEAIAEAGTREKDIVLLTENVRVGLRRHLSDHHVGPGRELRAVLVHPELEDQLRQSVRNAPGGSQLVVDPELLTRVLEELRAMVHREAPRGLFVLLTSMDVRRHLRKLTETEFWELPVLSFQELVADVRIVPVGQIAGVPRSVAAA